MPKGLAGINKAKSPKIPMPKGAGKAARAGKSAQPMAIRDRTVKQTLGKYQSAKKTVGVKI
jgi:hypothetical protein